MTPKVKSKVFKILNIYGTRPQIIKSYTLNHFLNKKLKKQISIVNFDTCQHYDKQLKFITPIFSGHKNKNFKFKKNYGSQVSIISKMMIDIEKIINKVKPDIGIIYGIQTVL